jgi:RNA polymerase sigma-70 factor (ECF subfamily)
MTRSGGREVVPIVNAPGQDAHLACSFHAPAAFARTSESFAPSQSVSHCSKRRRNRTNAKQEQVLYELFSKSRQRLVRVADSILRNHDDAEDAVQNAFLSACRHFGDFQGRSALNTWLTRIVINAALMVRRKQRNRFCRPFQDLTADDAVFVEMIQDPGPNPEQICSRAESFAFLAEWIDDMNPLLRNAVKQAYYDELSSREASSALAIPLTTYKARLFRGTCLLQDRARKQKQSFGN